MTSYKFQSFFYKLNKIIENKNAYFHNDKHKEFKKLQSKTKGVVKLSPHTIVILFSLTLSQQLMTKPPN